jgi:hypothetical protein
VIRSSIRFFGSKTLNALSACSSRLARALRRLRAVGAQVAGRHAYLFPSLAATARPLPACSALPPSAPKPPTLTPQPVMEVSNWGQKQGGSGLRVPVRRLLQVVAKTAPPAAAPAARAGAGMSALRPSRGAPASTHPPAGGRRAAFMPALCFLLGLVFIRHWLDWSV